MPFRNLGETVSSISDLYSVGTFAQIIEMREQGPILELVLNAQRRIRLLEQLDETSEDESKKSKVNGRRSKKADKDKYGQKKQDDLQSDQKSNNAYSSSLIFGKTENIKMDNIERTVELKALMQAIVQVYSFHRNNYK